MKLILNILIILFLASCKNENKKTKFDTFNSNKIPRQINYYKKNYGYGNYNNDLVQKHINSDLKNQKLIYILKFNSKGELTDSILKNNYNLRYEYEYERGLLKKSFEYYKNNINNTSIYEYDEKERLKSKRSIKYGKLNFDDSFLSKLETREEFYYSVNGNNIHIKTFSNNELVKSDTIIKDKHNRIIEKRYKEKTRDLDLIYKFTYLNDSSSLLKEINKFRNRNEFYEKEIYSYNENRQLISKQVSASDGFINYTQKISKSGEIYDENGNIEIIWKVMNKVLIIEYFENIYQ